MRVRLRIFLAKPKAVAAPRRGSGPGTDGAFCKETVSVVPEAVLVLFQSIKMLLEDKGSAKEYMEEAEPLVEKEGRLLEV